MTTLTYNLDTRTWKSADNRQITSISMKLRDRVLLAIRFYKNGGYISLGEMAAGKVGLKKKGIFSGQYIALASSWAPQGDAYVFDLNLNTDAAIAIFSGRKANATSTTLSLEVCFEESPEITSTALLSVRLENDLNQGTEGTPEAMGDLKATQQQAIAGVDDSRWMTPLRTFQAFTAWVSTNIPWSAITGKPATFTPSTHTHITSQITGFTSAAASAAPVQSVAGKTGVVTLTKADVGLGNTDNTSDASKPVSTAMQAALDGKANASHQHTISNITGLQAALDGKQGSGSYAPASGIAPSAITGTAVITTDSRLSDARNPTAHTHSYSSLTEVPLSFNPSAHTHAVSDVTGLQTALDGKQAAGSYQPAGSYATLIGGLVPASQLPSFVDDVLEFATISAFPATGETGKIYVATSTNKTYRWSGGQYIEIAASPGSTDAVTEGVSNLYFTSARAVAALATTLSSYATEAWVSARGYATEAWVNAKGYATEAWVNSALSGKAPITHNHSASQITGLSAVATSGNWDDINGKPALLQGEQGIAGEIGLSAYQVAVASGYVGTEEAWLLSLVGPVGPQGQPGESIQGPMGPQGESIQGPQGEPGPRGEQGIAGLSASVLNLPTDYDNFTITRTGGNVTSVSYSKNGDEIGVAILTWDTTVTPNRVATASDGTKTITINYDSNGQVIGGTS